VHEVKRRSCGVAALSAHAPVEPGLVGGVIGWSGQGLLSVGMPIEEMFFGFSAV